MHRYRLEFAAQSLDESRLRDLLERDFGLSGIVIIRDTAGSYAPPPLLTPHPGADLERALSNLLADGKPWRRKALIEKIHPLATTTKINAALIRMERAGAIRKPRHGVYISSIAPTPGEADIPPMNMAVERPSHQRLMPMLTKAMSAGDLRERLGVSRQRVDQMLKAMMKDGNVRRFEVAGEGSEYIYIRTEYFDKEILVRRAPSLHGARERFLSALAPETLSRVSDVALVAASAVSRATPWVEQLSAQGLVIEFKLGARRYVGITPRGLQHPQYDHTSSKASLANIVSDFGETRVRYIEHLKALGTARTIDLTYTMPEGSGYSGQIIQGLEAAGIIENIQTEKGRRPIYRLTSDEGEFIAGIVARGRTPPSVDTLRELIAYGHQARSEKLRLTGQKGNGPIGSATQASIVRALHNYGQLSTTQIVDKMEVKFTNSRSVHLALRTLNERCVIRRVGVGGHGSTLWQIEQAHLPIAPNLIVSREAGAAPPRSP
jgi:DNA-binding MarR family transcriptional regulator